ncbi:hypothetical protein JKP88DRAFT_237845 [Tribonema minus]|uniref:Uncharacterized protein n=1 Tax=Tribonema minus TaxID=303371 RepID=A0A835Z6K9_9STRA|nr:hypothetical protein JKP88DRAFT_237845 [Tribonema minus]
MESAGHRAYLKTRLAIEPPSKMQVRDWPAAFWACLVGCGLMWCTLAMLDAKSTVIIAKRAVAVVALVTPAAAVVRSSVPFKQQH